MMPGCFVIPWQSDIPDPAGGPGVFPEALRLHSHVLEHQHQFPDPGFEISVFIFELTPQVTIQGLSADAENCRLCGWAVDFSGGG